MKEAQETVTQNLRDGLEKIGLLGNAIPTRDTALKRLCEAHGDDAGIYYFGLLMVKLDKTRKEIRKQTDTHPRSLDPIFRPKIRRKPCRGNVEHLPFYAGGYMQNCQ